MSLPEPRSRVAATLLILVTLGLLAVQLVTNQPALGGVGLVLLLVPGFVVSQALGPRPLGWPEGLLTTLGASLVLAVLAGIIAALLPHGLDASSVAAVELVALSAASTIWLVRLMGHDVTWGRLRISVGPGSLLLVVVGLALGSAGFIVAVRGAQDQTYTSFVQLWSVPPTSGADQLLGVRNLTGIAVDCEAVILRPGQPEYDWHIGAVANGQSWLGPLPRRDGSSPGLWQISVHCAAPDGSTFDRRLSIDPPA
jgi:hypothetical protein